MSNTPSPKNKMYTILLVSPVPPPYGGIGIWTNNILNSKLSAKYKLLNLDTSPNKVVAKSKFTINRAVDAFILFYKLQKLLLLNRPNVVHITTNYFWAFYRDIIFGAIAKPFSKIILHIHGGDFPNFFKSIPFIFRKICHNSLRSFDKIIVITTETKEFLEGKLYLTNVVFIPNPIKANDFVRQRKNKKRLKVLFVGLIVQNKGVLDILNVASKINNANFIFIGPYVKSKNIDTEKEVMDSININKLNDRVRFLGAMAHGEIIEHYLDSDILLLPSYREGLPNVILEAMAAGLPIIATRVGAIPEIIENGVNGFLIEPGDRHGLLKYIDLLIQNESLRLKMSKENAEKALKYYDLDVVSAMLDRRYRELIAQ